MFEIPALNLQMVAGATLPLPVPFGGARVTGLNDISPHIGAPRVFRVFLDQGRDGPPDGSLILKIPDWGAETLRCLDVSRKALAKLSALPTTLVHGDFHTRNLGFDQNGNLVCIDWAHVGLSPLGGDIAILVSLLRAFGGKDGGEGMDLDRAVLDAYVAEVERLRGRRGLFGPISRAFALWHMAWGPHLRLVPRLAYLLSADPSGDPSVDETAVDIREGCQRPLFYRYFVGSGEVTARARSQDAILAYRLCATPYVVAWCTSLGLIRGRSAGLDKVPLCRKRDLMLLAHAARDAVAVRASARE